MLEEGIADILKKDDKEFISKSTAPIERIPKTAKIACVDYNTAWSYGKCCGGRRHGQSRCANGQT